LLNEFDYRYFAGVKNSESILNLGRLPVMTEAVKMTSVIQTVEALVLDLVEWVARKERSYEETMDAWRTSCPRLPVWEDANDHGLVCVENSKGHSCVRVTPAGFELLKKFRRERP